MDGRKLLYVPNRFGFSGFFLLAFLKSVADN